MKKILLISNYAHHYRLRIYNYFFKEFKKINCELILVTEGRDNVDFPIDYRIIVQKQNIKKYFDIIDTEKPEAVFIFLHLKDIINYPISIFCKFRGIPSIFWNKGINIKTPNNVIKNRFYYFLHKIADAIVLYTPNELTDIQARNREKVFFGYNSLSFEGLDRNKVKGLDYVREKYSIKENEFILFCATIKDDKKLDALLDTPYHSRNLAIVIAGRGIKETQLEKIKNLDNYYYIGKIPFDDYEMNSLFKSSKFFTTPGDLGLALVQAFYWGKPVVALDVPHSVERYYLESGSNGYLAKDMEDFWLFVDKLMSDSHLYEGYSENAFETYQKKAHVSNMFNGFKMALNFALKSKNGEK